MPSRSFAVLLLASLLSMALPVSAQKSAKVAVNARIPLRVFPPYLFMASPAPDVQTLARSAGVKFLTLAFIVSSDKGCAAQWRGGPTVSDENAISEQITGFRKTGGEVILSFGGLAGKELAETCPDATSLQARYQAVIDEYKVRAVDFDLESANSDKVVERRTKALVALKKRNPRLQVSFTLPADVRGIAPSGMELLKRAAESKLQIDVVNLLAMNYGASANPATMGQNAIDTAQSALPQLRSIGTNAHLGITSMIGVNDTAPEVFSLDDARALLRFAQGNPNVTRLSMWSLARDRACPAPVATASPDCSGIVQGPFEFAKIFNQFH